MTATLLIAASLTLPVAEVALRPDTLRSTYPGRVTSIAQVDVVPQVSGEIQEVAFSNGGSAKVGDVLYRIDPVKYEAAVKNAESKLAETKASAYYAEVSYERHKKLLEKNAVSLDAVDNALSMRDSTRAAYAAAQADLVAAQDDLKHCTIVAPIAGKLGSTSKTAGNYVTAGSPVLVTIVQHDPVRVAFSISNRELLMLTSGAGRRAKADVRIEVALADGSVYDGDCEIEYVVDGPVPQARARRHGGRFGDVEERGAASRDSAHRRAAGHAGSVRLGRRRGRRGRAPDGRARQASGRLALHREGARGR